MRYVDKDLSPIIYKMSVEELYERFNNNRVVNQYSNLLSLWYQTVERCGERVAITDGSINVSYYRLEHYSDKVAFHIVKNGWNHNGYILVQAKRNWKTIGIILGILKSGAAYVPIYESMPEDRQDLIKKETGCEIVLTSGDIFSDCPPPVAKYTVSGHQCAYVLFTSGSTGIPKGVMIPHLSVAETVQSVNRLLGLNKYDVVLGVSELTFDLSIFDLFGTFSAGARLVIVKDSRNLPLLEDLMIDQSVTTINTVPYVIKLFLEYLIALKMPMKKLRSLRTVILSGDVVPASTVDLILNNLKRTNLYIMGGPTEITVWSNYYLYEDGKQVLDYVPYGKPLANKTMYIVADKRLTMESGEIYSGKAGLALGYHGNEQLTKQQFIHFGELGRSYKTGDKGILTKDGLIRIMGRMDNQVKVNGFRVELEEVEKYLNDIEAVNQSISCVIEDKNTNRLVAGVKLKHRISESELKAILSKKIPAYSIPHHILILDEIPLSDNNKLNRKKFLEYAERCT